MDSTPVSRAKRSNRRRNHDLTKQISEPNLRHNTCFHHPTTAPHLGDVQWFPAGDLFNGYRHHDMVMDTIYAASAKGVQRAGRYTAARQRNEKERLAWSHG